VEKAFAYFTLRSSDDDASGNGKDLFSEVAWKWRVEKASPFSTLRSGNVDASAVWAVEMT